MPISFSLMIWLVCCHLGLVLADPPPRMFSEEIVRVALVFFKPFGAWVQFCRADVALVPGSGRGSGVAMGGEVV